MADQPTERRSFPSFDHWQACVHRAIVRSLRSFKHRQWFEHRQTFEQWQWFEQWRSDRGFVGTAVAGHVAGHIGTAVARAFR
jgi:hypothetical protein